jgi:hypothetical protein
MGSAEAGGAKGRGRNCAYNLFRNVGHESIACAVPVDRPVPSFISAGRWRFDGCLDRLSPCPDGFEDLAAAVGVRLNGFYIFQRLGPERPTTVPFRLRPARSRGSAAGDLEDRGPAIRAAGRGAPPERDLKP